MMLDFENYQQPLVCFHTEYHKQVHTAYALNHIPHPLPHEQFGAKKCFSCGKIKFSHFSAFSYIFPIKMYGNRQVAGGGGGGTCKSSPNDPELFVAKRPNPNPRKWGAHPLR